MCTQLVRFVHRCLRFMPLALSGNRPVLSRQWRSLGTSVSDTFSVRHSDNTVGTALNIDLVFYICCQDEKCPSVSLTITELPFALVCCFIFLWQKPDKKCVLWSFVFLSLFFFFFFYKWPKSAFNMSLRSYIYWWLARCTARYKKKYGYPYESKQTSWTSKHGKFMRKERRFNWSCR